jgi:Domain of unknown function (DUF5063)
VNVPDEVVAFENVARQYCSWAETQPGTPDDELLLAMRHVAELYTAALRIPETDPEPDAPERFVDKSSHAAVYRRFQVLPLQEYGEVFHATALPPEAPTVGDLADDLLDIYADLKSGLLHYDAGNVQQAVFQWRFSWGIHWGRHATSALRAMHCFVAEP